MRSEQSTTSANSQTSDLSLTGEAAKMCFALESQNPEFRDFGVSYISATSSIVLRKPPESVVENRVIITPMDEESQHTKAEWQKRLVDVGVECGLGVGFSGLAAVAACGGTSVTLGVSAPLCVWAAGGVGVSTLKCGTAIGKIINHYNDPDLNEKLEKNEYWKIWESAWDGVDLLLGVRDVSKGVKNIASLGKLSAKYGRDVVGRFSKAESKLAYREFAEACGETFTHQEARRWVNANGFSPRFSPSVVSSQLRTELLGVSKTSVNMYDNNAEINERHNHSPSWPKQTIVKGSINRGVDFLRKSQPTPQPAPSYNMHILQQVRP